MTDAEFDAILKQDFGSTGAKRIGLAQKANEKRENLNRDNKDLPLSQGGSFDAGYSMVDGNAVKNSNKIYNENTGAQQQQLLSDTYDQRIETDEQGRDFQYGDFKDGAWEKKYLDNKVNESYLYGGYGKGGKDNVKFGIGREGVIPRYTPDPNTGYGWESGPQGIDAENAFMNWRLPAEVAKKTEGMIHGNTPNIDSRTMFDDGTAASTAQREGLGTGASEYYDPATMSLMNAKTENIRKGLSPQEPPMPTPQKFSKYLSAGEKDDYLNQIKSRGRAGRGEGMFSEAVDMAQAAGVKSGADYLNLADKASQTGIMKPITDAYNKMAIGIEEFFGGDGKLGVLSDNGEDFLGSGKNIQQMRGDTPEAQLARDMFAGVDQKTRGQFSADLQASGKSWEQGNYMDSIKKAVPNLMYMLAESAPEMAELMIGGVGVVTAKRLSNQAEKYEEENGKPMSYGKMLETGVAIAGTLVMEKALVKSGVSGALGKVGKGAGVGKRSLAVGGSAAGEAVQEYAEGVQEKYATQKEGESTLADIATSAESVHQGVLGGLMGGALKGTGEATGAVVGAPADYMKKKEIQRQEDSGEYLVGENKDLAKSLQDMSHAEVQEAKQEAVDATEEMKNLNSIEEGLESKNPLIKRNAEQFIHETADTDVEAGSDRHIDNIGLKIRDAVLDTENADAQGLVQHMQDFLDIDVTKSTAAEIADAVYALEPEARKTITDGLPTDVTNRTADQKINEKGGFEVFKKQLNEIVADQNKNADQQISNWDAATKNYEKGVKKAPSELKEGKVNVKKVRKDTNRGKIGTLIDVVTMKNRSGINARKELNTYSDASLEEAYNNPEAGVQLKRYIKQVQEKRSDAKKSAKIDVGSHSPRELQNQLHKGDRKAYLDGIRKSLSPESYTDKRDVTAVRGILQTAQEAGYITDRQAEIFNKRLDKIGAKATDPSTETLKEEAQDEAESGLPQESIDNMKAAEVSRDDILKEADKLAESFAELNESDEGKEYIRIQKIEEKDRTKEEKEAFKKTQEKVDLLTDRLNDVLAQGRNYSQGEQDMNEAHSSTNEEWFYEDATEYNANEAFTEQEKKILGIC